ncbi:MAG: 2-amino-4-hydroxy-6-hydroxymethyldihydropteridine diphosphokinase [Desulfobulbus propionicus]|nr:MAG: 2-amino-4-hydroxy-6-hydroxymethyldihydropteridine diphosphokinase [Desulfobulbus propionicus]
MVFSGSRELALHPSIHVSRLSSPYRTAPFDMESEHAFINAALSGWTSLMPEALLEVLQSIEQAAGRVRSPEQPGYIDRTLDLDILLFGDQVIETEVLTVPHKEMNKRGFVLVPLAEIAPWAIHAVTGLSIREQLARLTINQGDIEQLQW